MSSRYDGYQHIQISQQDHVLTVTLDNPPLNGMTMPMHEEMTRVWGDIGGDTSVRVVILTGAGERGFCAGGDPKRMIENWGNRERWHVGLFEARAMILGMLECPKPVISRINGHAMGMGASIALAGDITVMVEDAKIADSHVSVGLAAGDGGALLWPNLFGLVEARRHLLTGLPLLGHEAAAKGLITESVARADLDAAVQRWVDTFLAKSPSAVQTTKQSLNLDIIDKTRRYMGEMLRLETRSWQSPNHPEAVKALIEKRRPEFIDE